MEEDFFFVLRSAFSDGHSPFGLFFTFVMGTLWGSFINVCIYRLPFGRSIVFPGSSCPHCGQPVEWWQNIPVLSYFLLKCKCFYCYNAISPRYPVMEFFTGIICTFLFYCYGGLNREFIYYFIFTIILIIVFFIDLDHWLILDSVTLPGMIVGVAGSLVIPRTMGYTIDYGWLVRYMPLKNSLCWSSLFDSLAGIIAGYAMFSFIAMAGRLLLKQEAMGGGDIKFAGVIGAFLGCQMSVISFLLSFFLGFFYALPLLLIKRKRGKDPVPFGTFMAMAAFIAMVWGSSLLWWLLNWPAGLQVHFFMNPPVS